MFSIKNKIIGIVILAVLSSLYFTAKQFAVIRVKRIEIYEYKAKNDSISVVKLSKENIIMDSLLYSMQSDIDILKANEKKAQIVILALRNEAKTATDAIEHYEGNGLMRYFVEDKKLFKKDCYNEVFEKPKNICK